MGAYVEWGALANVVVVGLIVGAGLPSLYAVGVWSLAAPGARDESGARRPGRIALAVVAFAVIMAAVVGALVYLASGGH